MTVRGLLVGLLCLALAGCGDREPSSSDPVTFGLDSSTTSFGVPCSELGDLLIRWTMIPIGSAELSAIADELDVLAADPDSKLAEELSVAAEAQRWAAATVEQVERGEMSTFDINDLDPSSVSPEWTDAVLEVGDAIAEECAASVRRSTEEVAAEGVPVFPPGTCLRSDPFGVRYEEVPCDQIHYIEVIEVFDAPEPEEMDLPPGRRPLTVDRTCQEELDDHLGGRHLPKHLDMQVKLPEADRWEDGERASGCWVVGITVGSVADDR